MIGMRTGKIRSLTKATTERRGSCVAPLCGEEIYEQTEQCPHCGDYVTHSTSALAGRPLWFIALGLLGIAATIYFLLR